MTPAAPGVRLERASAGLGAGRSAAPVSRDSQPISMHGRAALPAGGIEIAGASATALNMPFPVSTNRLWRHGRGACTDRPPIGHGSGRPTRSCSRKSRCALARFLSGGPVLQKNNRDKGLEEKK
jgi:hypothetical protein